MPSALACTTLSNIPPDRYERIQQVLEEKLGEIVTGNAGDIDEDGGDIQYNYDGKSILTISIIRAPHKFGFKISPQDVIAKVEKAIQGIA